RSAWRSPPRIKVCRRRATAERDHRANTKKRWVRLPTRIRRQPPQRAMTTSRQHWHRPTTRSCSLTRRCLRMCLRQRFRRPPPHRVPSSESLDRKSTRLNSSHVKISYAVFCLKKKKTLQYHIAFSKLSKHTS